MDISKSITVTTPGDQVATDLEMTHDDRLFVALYLERGRVTEAAIEAYQEPDPVKAGRLGNAALKRMPDVFAMVMDRAGLTDKDLIRRLLEGLDAEKTKFATHQGVITDERQVVDHQTRALYQRIALDLMGHAPKQALTIQDDAGRPLGPVILPVREGGHLQPGDITEAVVVPNPDPVETEGGDAMGQGAGVTDTSDADASPVLEEGSSGKNISDEGKDSEGWV